MCRRFTAETLSVCVIVLMFGTYSGADDLFDEGIMFDLSAPIEEPARSPGVSSGFQLTLLADDTAEPVQADLSGPAGDPAAEKLMTLDEPTPAAPVTQQGAPHWNRPAPNYPLPSRSFSAFQSPASYGWAFFERCAPTPFTPRGNGIPRRTSAYRMDYRPYTLQNNHSTHGPAFYQRFDLCPCPECHFHKCRLEHYYGCQYDCECP